MNTTITRYHSCTRCQQRNIKCDGGNPCAACQKANAECTRNHRNSLATRRRRGDYGSGNTRSQARLETGQTETPAIPNSFFMGADLISPPASNSTRQIPAPTAHTPANHGEPLKVESFLFNHSPDQALPNLAWPQPVQIFQLWQTYIDNVNPMVNLLHTQTVQRMVLQATACKQEELPKQSRALLSSVFLAAIESLSDEDCLNLMVLPKDECVKNLFVMTKECLVDANFMEVATTEVLQALVLYLVGLILSHLPHIY